MRSGGVVHVVDFQRGPVHHVHDPAGHERVQSRHLVVRGVVRLLDAQVVPVNPEKKRESLETGKAKVSSTF